jgi:hypothetical protein
MLQRSLLVGRRRAEQHAKGARLRAPVAQKVFRFPVAHLQNMASRRQAELDRERERQHKYLSAVEIEEQRKKVRACECPVRGGPVSGACASQTRACANENRARSVSTRSVKCPAG